MYFDALTLAAVADDIRERCLGGRVQRVVQTGPLSIGLEIYRSGQRHQLLLSAHPQHARVHLATEKVSRGIEQATPLLLLLRKYVLGGRLNSVEQPPLERVLVLSIAKEPRGRNRDDASDELLIEEGDAALAEGAEPLYCELIAELMERRSNIVLVSDENLVLASVKRVTAAMSSRQIEPQLPYTLPPRQEKRDPRSATAEGLQLAATSSQRSLAQAIVGSYRGVSPQVAREAIFRATGSSDQPAGSEQPWQQIAHELTALYTPAARHPSLLLQEGQPRAFAPYAPLHLGQAQAMPSMSAALDAFYTPQEGLTAHRQRREQLQADLLQTRGRLERQRDILQAELSRAADLDRLRWEGEMIFGYLHSIAPGQAELQVEGQTINLNPTLSAVENAQARFKAYDKAKGALAGVPERLAVTEGQIAHLDELRVLLGLADSFEQITLLAAEAFEAGYLRQRPAQVGKKALQRARSAPLSLRSGDGLTIYVGRSAGQNAEVTFRLGRKDDLWLHARQIPGSHVIIRSDGRAVPETTLLEAAAYAAYYSGARSEAAVDVDVCRRSHVRKVPGAPAGLVTYRAEQTLRVAPHRPGQA